MSAPTDDPLPAGTLVGDYEIVGRLGRGAMGTVYETHTELHGPAALKILSLNAIAQDPGARERFLREGQAAARIRHPHVLKIFHVGRFQPTGGEPLPYLVMELLLGDSLHARLHREPKLPIPVLCDVLVPVLAGVQAAHASGVIHRDLKPDNIFLDAAEGPKVVDFGISKIVGAPSGTRVGLIFGTPEYLAPELMNGTLHAGPKSDQYALGVPLYKAACGRPPFHWDAEGESFQTYAMRIQVGEFIPPRQLRPDLPGALADAICRALHKQAEKRFPTLRDLGRTGRTLLPFACRSLRRPRPRLSPRLRFHRRFSMIAGIACGSMRVGQWQGEQGLGRCCWYWVGAGQQRPPPHHQTALSKPREDFIDALCDVPPKPAEMAQIIRINQGREGNTP